MNIIKKPTGLSSFIRGKINMYDVLSIASRHDDMSVVKAMLASYNKRLDTKMSMRDVSMFQVLNDLKMSYDNINAELIDQVLYKLIILNMADRCGDVDITEYCNSQECQSGIWIRKCRGTDAHGIYDFKRRVLLLREEYDKYIGPDELDYTNEACLYLETEESISSVAEFFSHRMNTAIQEIIDDNNLKISKQDVIDFLTSMPNFENILRGILCPIILLTQTQEVIHNILFDQWEVI